MTTAQNKSTIQVGKDFEKIGEEILKKEGYEIKELSSRSNWLSKHDFIVKKNNKEFFVEVRGRTLKNKYSKYFSLSAGKIEYLKSKSNAIVLCIQNSNNYIILNINDIKSNSVALKCNNKTFRVIVNKNLYKRQDAAAIFKYITINGKKHINEITTTKKIGLHCNSNIITMTKEKQLLGLETGDLITLTITKMVNKK